MNTTPDSVPHLCYYIPNLLHLNQWYSKKSASSRCSRQNHYKYHYRNGNHSQHGKLGLSQVGSQSGGVLGDLNLSRFVFFCPCDLNLPRCQSCVTLVVQGKWGCWFSSMSWGIHWCSDLDVQLDLGGEFHLPWFSYEVSLLVSCSSCPLQCHCQSLSYMTRVDLATHVKVVWACLCGLEFKYTQIWNIPTCR